MNDTVLADTRDGILFLTLNRPSALNAVDVHMSERMAELGETLGDVAGEARVIVLRGAGPSFMAGGDIHGFKAHLPNVGEMLGPLIDGFHMFVRALASAPQPVLASVQGAAAGGGFSLAIACDLVIAAENAKLALAYRKLGTSTDGGASYMLPRVLGHKRAMEMLLLSGTMTAADALAAGLVNRVVPADKLEAETMCMARDLAANSVTSNAAMKDLLRSSDGNSLAAQLELERVHFLDCAASPDFAEGVTAFLEKRSPVF